MIYSIYYGDGKGYKDPTRWKGHFVSLEIRDNYNKINEGRGFSVLDFVRTHLDHNQKDTFYFLITKIGGQYDTFTAEVEEQGVKDYIVLETKNGIWNSNYNQRPWNMVLVVFQHPNHPDRKTLSYEEAVTLINKHAYM